MLGSLEEWEDFRMHNEQTNAVTTATYGDTTAHWFSSSLPPFASDEAAIGNINNPSTISGISDISRGVPMNVAGRLILVLREFLEKISSMGGINDVHIHSKVSVIQLNIDWSGAK